MSVEIQPACLPMESSTFPEPETQVYLVGWGDTSNNRKKTDALKNVNLTVYKPEVCRNVAYSVDKNWNSQLCGD